MVDQKPFGTRTTRIEYRAGHESAASEMSRRVPGLPPVVASTAMRPGVDVRVVLGRELPGDVALLPVPEQLARSGP